MGYLADLRAQGLVINDRQDWQSSYDYSAPRTVTTPALYFFLHIAVVSLVEWRATMRKIEDIGAARFPNTGISYNAAVFPDGRLADAQPLTRRGAHTINDLHTPGFVGPGTPQNLNYTARALVLPQQVANPVTDAQIDAAARWGAACIRAGYVKRGAHWFGHRDVAAKDCPGSKAYARLDELQQLTDDYVTEGLDTDMELTDRFELSEAVKATIPGNLETLTVQSALGYGAGAYFQALKNAASIGALQGAFAELVAREPGTPFTLAEIELAAKAGAEAALAEGVDVHVTVDDQEPVP